MLLIQSMILTPRPLFLTATFMCLSIFGAGPAQAEMTVGAEFEFVDPKAPDYIASGLKGFEEVLAQRFVEAARRKCVAPTCKETVVNGKWGPEVRFTWSSHFWYQVGWDPNVVEVITKPITLSAFRELAPEIQDAIFESAKEAGLTTDPKKRAGHFNFGAHASFNNNAMDFLKFVIDFSNRPELSLGILRDPNPLNSPALAGLSSHQRESLSRIARSAFDPRIEFTASPSLKVLSFLGEQGKHPAKMSLREMAGLVIKNVFSESTKGRSGPEAVHSQALGLKYIPGSSPSMDGPLENRGVRSQRDVWDFILLAELFEARIEYLKTLPLKVSLLVTETSRTTFTTADLVNRCYIYINESGLSWERYSRLLPRELLSSERPSEFFTGKLQIKSGSSVEQVISMLDLLPTSPWLQAKLQDAVLHKRFSYDAWAQIKARVTQASEQKSYSREARQEFKRISLLLPVTGVPICSTIFN